jgi:hypothetical protein
MYCSRGEDIGRLYDAGYTIQLCEKHIVDNITTELKTIMMQ